MTTPGFPLPPMTGETVLVLGLGKSGLATVRACLAAGAAVRAWDDKEAARDAAVALGAVADNTVAGTTRLILSPGIPRAHPQPHPLVAAAMAAGIAIENDIDLLARAAPALPTIAITGTNGKSTTTALTAHVLKAAGLPAIAGGNIGLPALDLPVPATGGWAVLELSSYQLETVSAGQFRVGVFLNIAPDHLDRYVDMDAYVAAKVRLFDNQPDGAAAIVGIDDAYSRATAERLSAEGRLRVIALSVTGADWTGPEIVRVDARGGLIDGMADGGESTVADLTRARTLVGRHNWQNAAAAYAAGRLAGLAAAAAAAGLFSFPGLAHRQQLVAEIDGIRFVNDSKATNPDAAVTALLAYPRIYWIAGNKLKPGSLDALIPGLAHVAEAFLIGEGARRMADFLRRHGVRFSCCGTLEAAIDRAAAAAGADRGQRPVVLLSPAGASFDQFSGFEARGDAFVRLVERRYKRGEAGSATQPPRVLGVC